MDASLVFHEHVKSPLESAVFGTKPYVLIHFSYSAVPLLENLTNNECIISTASEIYMFFVAEDSLKNGRPNT